jgi:hypothetical protein
MKRDMDLVREILLAVEAGSFLDLDQLLSVLKTGQRNFDDPVCYHIKMLVEEAGLLSARDAKSLDGPYWLRLELTWTGHEFLNNIRDSAIWAETKAGAQKLGGFSFELVGALAKGLVKKQIENYTGVELGI